MILANISPEQFAALQASVYGQQGQVGSAPMQQPPIPINNEGLPVVGTTGAYPIVGGHGGGQNPYTYQLDQYGNLVAVPPQYVAYTPRYAYGV